MQIKAADDRSADIQGLEALLARPGLPPATHARIAAELRSIRAGIVGERDAAYEIEFHFGSSSNYVTIHDLRLEHDGRIAQIDHLIINRVLQVWVCESKHFVDSVAINAQGEWTRSYRGREYGVPSPIEQNRKHIEVLDSVFKSGLVNLPRRVFTMRPELRSLILVSNNAFIKRPRARIDGIESVIKAERLKPEVFDTFDDSVRTMVGRLVSSATIERIARELAALHRPIKVDWAARFGVPASAPAPEPSQRQAVSSAVRGAPTDQSPTPCDHCGGPTTFAEVAFCRYNKPRFRGATLCRPCQALVSPVK